MVWTACEREDFVAEVQAMRRRVEQLVPADVRAREIKLGTGGLRDVEFAVQLLQLVHGRSDESLHVASTVDALAALGEGGYIGRDDAANMTASYEFLRLLEHRLQLQRLKRTHMLPEADDDEAVRWLARAAHIRPDGRHDAAGVLREELKRQSVRVSRLHAKLFYQPLLESIGPAGAGDRARHDTGGRRASARRAGLRGPADRADPPVGAGQPERPARPGAVGAAAAGCWTGCRTPPTPTAGCWHTGGSARRWPTQKLVPGDAARQARGGQAADARAGHLGVRAGPADARARRSSSITPTGRPARSCSRPSPTRWRARWSPRRAGTPTRCGPSPAARTLRRRELARIASADLLGMLEVTEVCKALTSVWVAVLQAALDAVIRANLPEDGRARAAIAVIGMGRLGGGELGYGSDADVMFVCEPAGGVDESVAVRWSVIDRRAGSRTAGHSQRRSAAGGRRQPAARGPQRSAGPHAGVL